MSLCTHGQDCVFGAFMLDKATSFILEWGVRNCTRWCSYLKKKSWAGFIYLILSFCVPLCCKDENMTQKACRSLIQQMVPKSKGDGVLRRTRICTQHITEIKVPPGTCIRVNNNKHNLVPSPQELIRYRCETFLHQEFKYDLMNFNSEHFATFIRYGLAVSNLVGSATPEWDSKCIHL